MSTEAIDIFGAVAMGIGATLIMDLWNLFLKRAFSIPSLDYCLLGRWLRHMPAGTFRHASITAAPPKPFECTVGWIAPPRNVLANYGEGTLPRRSAADCTDCRDASCRGCSELVRKLARNRAAAERSSLGRNQRGAS